MGDKTFRPITDVEIVEQMTENDTVLIEQNGMIKRTKGVVGGGGSAGGGEKYVIEVRMGAEGMITAWNKPVVFDEFVTLITEGNYPEIILSQVDDVVGVVQYAKPLWCALLPDGSGVKINEIQLTFLMSTTGQQTVVSYKHTEEIKVIIA